MPSHLLVALSPGLLVSGWGLGLVNFTALSRGQMGLIAAIVGLSIMLMLSARRRRKGEGYSPRAYAREQVARLREEGEIKEHMEELLARVQDAARDLNAQLDTRFHKLERVIRDADARIGSLERLVRAADGRPVCDVTVAGDDRGPAVPPPKRENPGVNSRYTGVYDLADMGRSAIEIAQATGQTPGEIELILALRPKCAAS